MRARCAGLPLMVTLPVVGEVRSPISRRSVDLPQPDGPMSETNSPSRIEKSMSSRAWVRPAAVSKTLLTPLISTTALPRASPGPCCTSAVMPASPDGGVGTGTKREELQEPDGDEERQAQERRGEHRRPQLLGPGDVLLVEVEDRAAQAELAAAGVPLPHDRPDDARRRRDLQ